MKRALALGSTVILLLCCLVSCGPRPTVIETTTEPTESVWPLAEPTAEITEVADLWMLLE